MKSVIVSSFIICLTIFNISGCKDTAQEKNINNAKIVFFLGDVKVKGGSSWQTPQENMDIKRGYELKTGKTGQCNILVGANSYISVKENTHMIVDKLFKNDAGTEESSFELKFGKSVISPKKLLKGDKFEIKTPTAIAAVRGTKFVVESKPQGKLKVAVVKGKVEVKRRIPVLEKVDEDIVKKSDTLSELKTKVEDETIIVDENESAFIDNKKAEQENQVIEEVVNKHVEEIKEEIATEVNKEEELAEQPEKKDKLKAKVIQKKDFKIEKALASLTIMEKGKKVVKEIKVTSKVEQNDIQAVEKLDKEIQKEQQKEEIKQKIEDQTRLTIQSPVKSSKIYVNGKYFGKDNVTLNPKEGANLKIQIRAVGYEDFVKEITLAKGDKKNVTAKFIEAARLIIKSPVKNSRIYVNAKYYGKHEVSVSPGSGKNITVVVVTPGYKRFSTKLVLEAGSTKELEVDLVRSKALDRVRWSRKVGKNVTVAPVFYGGIMLVSTADGNLIAMNKQGKRLWKAGLKRSIEATPVVHKGLVYVVTSSGKFYALNVKSGKVLWKKDLVGALLFGSQPVVYKKNIYIATSLGKIYAFTLQGKELWQKDVENGIYASPVVSNNILYVGAEDHNIYAFDTADGDAKWKFNTDGRIVASSPVVKNKVLYVGTYAGSLYAIKSGAGDLLWKFRAKDSILSSPVIIKNRILFGSNDKYLYTLNISNGKLIWKYKANDKIVTKPAIADNFVYITSGKKIQAVDLRTGKLQWQHQFDNRIKTAASVSGNDIILGLDNGDVASVRQNVLKSYE